MKRLVFLLLITLSVPFLASAQKELQFANLDSLFAYAGKYSSVSRTGEQQVILARYQKLAAVVNCINFRDPLAFSLTDNTTLPVTYIPAEVFGGKPGTFRELTFGQQYVGNFTITPQIDIINPGAWSRIRSANLSEELTDEQNLLNKKSLFESVSACYYNILALQDQIRITQEDISATDTLLLIVSGKYAQGLVRHQDVNDAKANQISLADRKQQLVLSLEQQYKSLSILCDAPAGTQLVVQGQMSYTASFTPAMNVNSQLLFKVSALQTELAKADLRTNRLLNLPVVSLLYSNSYYENSNDRFFDNAPGAKWLNSAYFGAKITWYLPDVNQIVMARNSKINYQIAEISFEHNKVQNDVSNTQLQLDYEKAWSQFNSSKQICLLKEENFTNAKDQYSQSVLPFDKLLLAFNELTANRLSYSSALANLLFLKSKMDINNQIK
jgi:outer membrane protein TolC